MLRNRYGREPRSDARRRSTFKRVWPRLVLAILVSLLAGCGDESRNPQTGSPTAQAVAAATARPASTPTLIAEPTTPVPDQATVASPTIASSATATPAIATLTAMPTAEPAATVRHAITALDATTGSVRWQQNLPLTNSHLLLGGDALYLIDDTESLVALDLANGTERWRIPAPYGSLLSVADETTAYLEFDQAVHAIDAVTGQERWVVAGFSTVAAGDGIVVGWPYPPESGSRVLDAATGQERWSIAAGMIQQPIIAGSTVYAALTASERGGEGAYALDAVTGATRWVAEMPGGHAVAVTAGTVILSWERSSDLIGVDAGTGQERWRYTTSGSYGIEHIATSDGGVYIIVGSADNGSPLVAIDPQSGAVRWEATGYRWPIGAPTGLVVANQPPTDDASQLLALDATTGVWRWSYASDRIRELVVTETAIVVATWGTTP
jgi:outer membrane protein assembly factor BamB